MNSIVSSVSECTAFLLAGFLIDKFGIKYTLIMSYIMAISGMLALITTKTDN